MNNKIDKFSEKKIIEQLNETLSEAHLGYLNGIPKNTKITIGRAKEKLAPVIMVYQAMAYLASKKLLPSTNKVLMLFFSMSSFENFIGMDIQTIQEELGLTKSTVIIALNELVDNQIVIKTKNVQDSRRHDYFINPLAAWKGGQTERTKMIRTMKIHSPGQLSLFSGDIMSESDLYTKSPARKKINH